MTELQVSVNQLSTLLEPHLAAQVNKLSLELKYVFISIKSANLVLCVPLGLILLESIPSYVAQVSDDAYYWQSFAILLVWKLFPPESWCVLIFQDADY